MLPRILACFVLALALAGAGSLHLGLVSHGLDEEHLDAGACAVCQGSSHGGGEPALPAALPPILATSEAAPRLPGSPSERPSPALTPTRAPPVHS